MKVFLAGAAGVVGRRLTILLRRAGHEVAGTTRSEAKAAALRAIGAVPVLVDAYDADKLKLAVYAVQPDVIIHQLTDLPQTIDPNTLQSALAANARLRITGTRNLIDAALTNNVRRVIAQSIAFAYAPGHAQGQPPLIEDHPIDPAQTGVIALERAVTQTAGIDGIVLRYGRFYGPGTWTEVPNSTGPLHVDAAAQAALLALTKGKPGIYNIAEDDGAVSSEKAKRDLGFDASFRIEP
ncbi:NAD(P)-dependent oxidoreductase [Pseudorhodoplanes sp.]|uniref:NAD-dependent epimerase/dehydratase family protein n=1 Tax=Pseudorhodoplanes sp. TaxID=1934341 RepID=UPI002BC4C9CB|nr:NAD(P)-dependent oxidoreductase [Pseudorhodoplanes sp.]HWV54066.1 NAD(P)-dependent oxidoreductase [Pseudorhodoplanes sp.]